MATSSASISGLSGFDGASLVDQLMQLEAITKNNLTTRVKGEQNVVATLRSLNTALAKLGEQAAALGKPETWNALKATSSSTAVTVTSDATASATQLDFTVVSVAAAHQLGFNDAVSLTDVVTPTSITFAPGDPLSTVPGKTLTTDGTLKGLVDAINADPDLGLRATTVRSGSGYKLLVEATETGATHAFTMVSGVDGSQVLGGSSVRAGSDAVINMGALSVTSATNTFTDLVPGVDVTVGAAAVGAPAVSVTLAKDPKGVTDGVKALVDAANAILTGIEAQASYNATTGAAGALLGDATVRALRSALADTIYAGDGTSLAEIGIDIDRYGKFVFDAERFGDAYAADAGAVAARFSGETGYAARIESVAKAYSDPFDGALSHAITGRTSSIDHLEDSIDAWDIRLELRRNTLSRQFTALEVALSTMNSQSSWLTQQLSSMMPSS